MLDYNDESFLYKNIRTWIPIGQSEYSTYLVTSFLSFETPLTPFYTIRKMAKIHHTKATAVKFHRVPSTLRSIRIFGGQQVKDTKNGGIYRSSLLFGGI